MTIDEVVDYLDAARSLAAAKRYGYALACCAAALSGLKEAETAAKVQPKPARVAAQKHTPVSVTKRKKK